MKERATVSIALYGNLAYTRQCLKFLFQNTPKELYKLILINNASPDNTLEWLLKNKHTFPVETKIINSKTNLNFAGAHNIASEKADTRYMCFLNNDIIPLKNWLQPMVEDLDKDKKAAVVGSKLIRPQDNTLQHAAVVFYGILPIHRYFGFGADYPKANKKEYVPMVTGACFLVRRKLFLDMGGFDEKYKNGWEDPHFCLVLKEKGWKVIYEPKSVLYHYEGRSEGRMLHDEQNKAYFLRTWGEKIRKWLKEGKLTTMKPGEMNTGQYKYPF